MDATTGYDCGPYVNFCLIAGTTLSRDLGKVGIGLNFIPYSRGFWLLKEGRYSMVRVLSAPPAEVGTATSPAP